ncbi:MAG: ChaN family lipoprotein [Nitrospiraceae bacterium]
MGISNTSRSALMSGSRKLVGLTALLLVDFLLLTGCNGEVRPIAAQSLQAGSVAWSAGQVIDTKTGTAVPRSEWEKALAQYDVIYLGEEHHNSHHIAAALEVLQAMLDQGRQPTLAMEMFGWDGQPALDEYLRSTEASRTISSIEFWWKQNWGGPFEDYEPLVQFAKDHRLSVIAFNPPKTSFRLYSTEPPRMRRATGLGLRGMASETIVDDPAYRDRILSQLQACQRGRRTGRLPNHV